LVPRIGRRTGQVPRTPPRATAKRNHHR